MAVSADVDQHLDRNYPNLRDTFLEWSRLGPREQRNDAVLAYFEQANLGDTESIGSASAVTSRSRADKGAPNLLILGSHDTSDLSPSTGRASSVAGDELRGPGTGSLIGPTMAFVEGFKATVMTPGDEPVNMHALSVGPGDTAAALIAELALTDLDAIVMTNAVAWAPEQPTVTTGSRGLIEAHLTVTAGEQLHDQAYAGASLNPLNRLVDVIASLRGDGGRIALPDFYERAERPERGLFDSFDDTWVESLGGARPSGSLPSLDRATQWPVISLLDIETDAEGGAAPRSATARVAMYLVPNQRPVEVERSIRQWFTAQMPENLVGTVRIERAARPYRSHEDLVATAQQQAIKKVYGRTPLIVPAGGAIGAGELHYQTAAPILFAGICGPRQRWGSTDEALTQSLFDKGVAVAAETCLQLAKKSSARGVS